MKYINEYNDYEKNLFNQVNSKPEVYIANLIKDLKIEYFDEYPNSTFFVHKNTGEIWMEYNKNVEFLWVSYEDVWSKVESKFPYEDLDVISKLIKYTVEFAFKMEVGIPNSHQWGNPNRWKFLSR